MQGAAAMAEFQPEVLLACGGGSPIDVAKACRVTRILLWVPLRAYLSAIPAATILPPFP